MLSITMPSDTIRKASYVIINIRINYWKCLQIQSIEFGGSKMQEEEFQLILSQEDYHKLLSEKNISEVSLQKARENLQKLQEQSQLQKRTKDRQIQFLKGAIRNFIEYAIKQPFVADVKAPINETDWYESVSLDLQKNQSVKAGAHEELRTKLIKKHLVQLNGLGKIRNASQWQLVLISDQEQKIKKLEAEVKRITSATENEGAKVVQEYEQHIKQIHEEDQKILLAQKMISKSLQDELNNKEKLYQEKYMQQIISKDKQINYLKDQQEKAGKTIGSLRDDITLKNEQLKTFEDTIQQRADKALQTNVVENFSEKTKILEELLKQKDEQIKKLQAKCEASNQQIKSLKEQHNVLIDELQKNEESRDNAIKQLKSFQNKFKKLTEESEKLRKQVKAIEKPKQNQKKMEKQQLIRIMIDEYYHEVEQNLVSMNALEFSDIVQLIDNQLQAIQEHITKVINENKKRAKK